MKNPFLIAVDSDNVKGKGTTLFSVSMPTFGEMSEGMSTQLWLADNEDHLYDQVSEDVFRGSEEPSNEQRSEFDGDWDTVCIIFEIGKGQWTASE